ncbi:MAG: hypothetical protein GY697_03350 [Desulfobacterales bacterium]|nr:hypothetical protein [Desulfobacterales bacterium]
MENRIKEQQLDLFADRTSAHGMASNQFRLYLYSWAYIILETLRRVGLVGTDWFGHTVARFDYSYSSGRTNTG